MFRLNQKSERGMKWRTEHHIRESDIVPAEPTALALKRIFRFSK